MGEIEVDPEALRQLGQQVRKQVGQASQAAGQASQAAGQAVGQSDLWLGAGPVDAALQRFSEVWGGRLDSRGESGGQLASSIDAAAEHYRQTDRTAMPESGDARAGDTP